MFSFCSESILFSCILRAEELLERTRDQMVSDYGLYIQICVVCLSLLCSHYLTMSSLVVMFFRFVTSGEIQRRAEFFEPFISGLTNSTVVQVSSILPFYEGLYSRWGGIMRYNTSRYRELPHISIKCVVPLQGPQEISSLYL
jgi:hypothetical protein